MNLVRALSFGCLVAGVFLIGGCFLLVPKIDLIAYSAGCLKRSECIIYDRWVEARGGYSGVEISLLSSMLRDVVRVDGGDVALNSQRLAVAGKIVAAGANVNASEMDGMTVLHLAILDNDFEFARFLVEHDAVLTPVQIGGRRMTGIDLVEYAHTVRGKNNARLSELIRRADSGSSR